MQPNIPKVDSQSFIQNSLHSLKYMIFYRDDNHTAGQGFYGFVK